MHKVFLSLLLLITVNSQTVQAQQSNTKTALEFLSFLSSSKYEEALNKTTVDFKAKLSVGALSKTWSGLNKQFGPYETVLVPDSMARDVTPLTLQTTFQDYVVPITFHFNATHEIIGFFIQQTPKLRSTVGKSPASFPEEEIKIKVNGGIIGGTIMTPKNPLKDMPVALIIAGSGPTDRNGNNPYGVQANTYLLLAEALADNGIASFRYDKRLIGESVNFNDSQDKVVFSDFVEDAVTLGNFLKDRREFGKLYLIGHSEGSNIGIVASEQLKPNAFVSLCGPGENLSTIIENQLLSQPELGKKAKPIINLLKQGKTTTNIPAELNSLFAPSIQPFIISSFKVNPVEEIKKLSLPLLIIGGTTDLQVPINHAQELKQANPKATLLLVKNMNHVLKTAPSTIDANLATYKNPKLPLNTDLVIGLVNFLK